MCVFLGCTAACSSTETTADPAAAFASIDPDFELVREISLDLALLGYGLELEHFTTCLVAGTVGGDPDSFLRADQTLQRLTAEASNVDPTTGEAELIPDISQEADRGVSEGRTFMCEVLSEAVAEKEAVFKIVKETGAVPSGLHTFSTYSSTSDIFDPDRQVQEAQVGPFQDMEKCAALEQSLRDAGFPTRRCQEWAGGPLHELVQESKPRE